MLLGWSVHLKLAPTNIDQQNFLPSIGYQGILASHFVFREYLSRCVQRQILLVMCRRECGTILLTLHHDSSAVSIRCVLQAFCGHRPGLEHLNGLFEMCGTLICVLLTSIRLYTLNLMMNLNI